MAVNIFCCYAHEDELLVSKLITHLKPLQRQGIINEIWWDRDVNAGTEWEKEIQKHLHDAQVILLLISADFLASEYCFGVEMQHAMERNRLGLTLVIPVILRPSLWENTPFGKLQVLPKDSRPISNWPFQDNAFLDVAEGIRRVLENPSPPFHHYEPGVPFSRPPRRKVILLISAILVLLGSVLSTFYVLSSRLTNNPQPSPTVSYPRQNPLNISASCPNHEILAAITSVEIVNPVVVVLHVTFTNQSSRTYTIGDLSNPMSLRNEGKHRYATNIPSSFPLMPHLLAPLSASFANLDTTPGTTYVLSWSLVDSDPHNTWSCTFPTITIVLP